MAGSILHHPAEPVELVLADGARVYRLRVPRVADRPRFRRALLAEGGRQWSLPVLVDRLSDAAGRLMPEDEEREGVLADLEAMRAALARAWELMRAGTPSDAPEIGELMKAGTVMTPRAAALARLAQDQDPDYANALADNAVYQELRGIVAARQFVVGWSGLEGEPARSGQGLTEASLALIPAEDLLAIGLRVEELISPPEATRKNSASPSGGPSGPATSPDPSAPPETSP